ncbi:MULTISPECIES: cation diffusion facilitator family transporter [Giesbergeria]|uniref:Cation diffusion facilitator family transporter n=1 Tax=Giesbergeria sinuosa TaxID=80883 RepID=A0ABV9QA57_9BURK
MLISPPAALLAWLTPRNLLWASVGMALTTMALKTLAWYVTGSVGLLSDAMESLVNLASAMFGVTMVTVAAQPADDNHPYGHHKAEYFASGFEGMLIFVAAGAILWTAVERLLAPQPLAQMGWGLALSVFSSLLNGGLAWVMLWASRRHRSIALEADARHLFTDVWTSAGVVLGLGAVALTGWNWLDPIVAIGVALNILKEGVHLVWRSSQGLMDEAVEPQVRDTIQHTLTAFLHQHNAGATPAGCVRFDHITTRMAGQRRFVELHMHIPGHWTLTHAAELRGQVEQALMQAVPGLRARIELLPCHVESYLDPADMSEPSP